MFEILTIVGISHSELVFTSLQEINYFYASMNSILFNAS